MHRSPDQCLTRQGKPKLASFGLFNTNSLVSYLQDTVVRYSAAKGLSRLCSRLPGHFIDQIADAVTSLFAINVADIMGAANDLNAVSEHTWQGACLALAEMGRRGLLRGEELGEKLEWVQKALLFDVRRGSHSVGTGVRDAACYVLWALARAHDAEALRPFALQLARRLVTVACLDRDISIRRAASAAFQECVGRLGLFPHGIDVMRMTDFFAVSVRRNAFLECAPQVAAYEEYRNELLKHLLTVTVVHWDVAMRELAAQSVARIVAIDLETLAPPIVSRMAEKCKSRDTHVLHGVLLTLGALGIVCSTKDGEVADSLRFKVSSTRACQLRFYQLTSVPSIDLRLPFQRLSTFTTNHRIELRPSGCLSANRLQRQRRGAPSRWLLEARLGQLHRRLSSSPRGRSPRSRLARTARHQCSSRLLFACSAVGEQLAHADACGAAEQCTRARRIRLRALQRRL